MTLDDLTTPMTADEAKAAIYAYLAARGVSTTNWKAGSVVRTMIAAVSVVLAALSSLQAAVARGGFLDLASGDWLTLLARYVYNVDRDLGSFASGFVTLNNTGGGSFSGDPDDLIFRNPTTGKLYRNTAAYTIAPLETGVLVAIQAVELGSASTSAASTITAMDTPLIGVTCSNAAAVVGSDPEDDQTLRIRCREKTGTASPNGPADAYAYFARSAKRPDGSSIGVTRVRVVPDGIGGVDVYVATASGGVTGSSGSPATDLGIIHEELQTKATPQCITERTSSASALTVAVTYELWVRSTVGATSSEIQATASERLVDYMAAQPIGGEIIPPAVSGSIYVSALEAVVGSAVPRADLVRVAVTLPAADVAVGATEAPVLGTVTCTAVHFVGAS